MQLRWQTYLDAVYSLPGGPLLVFGIKQAWAALFGGLLLLAIVVTKLFELPWLARYDWLFLAAILIQIGMLLFRLERPREVLIILLFHLVGLGMELFKTSALIGSWQYPEEAFFRIAGVPLFTGFMYAAVGSYIARAWRVLDLEITHYPRRIYTCLVGMAIYINFFSHHFAPDMRWVLFVCVCVLYARTVVVYRLSKHRHTMPLLVGFGLIALFIWFAENIGTATKTWLYPAQIDQWHPVSIQKFGSWLLLMIVSFIMIDLLHYVYNRAGRSEVHETVKK